MTSSNILLMKRMKIFSFLELVMMKKMNRIPHKTILSKPTLAGMLENAFRISKDQWSRKALSVRSRVFQTDFYERCVEAGIIKKRSPDSFDRNKLHYIFDNSLFNVNGMDVDFLPIDYQIPRFSWSSTED